MFGLKSKGLLLLVAVVGLLGYWAFKGGGGEDEFQGLGPETNGTQRLEEVAPSLDGVGLGPRAMRGDHSSDGSALDPLGSAEGEALDAEATDGGTVSIKGRFVPKSTDYKFRTITISEIREIDTSEPGEARYQVERARVGTVGQDTGEFAMDGVKPGEYRLIGTSSAGANDYVFYRRTFWVVDEDVDLGEIQADPYWVEVSLDLKGERTGNAIPGVTDELRKSPLTIQLTARERARPGVGFKWEPGSNMRMYGLKAGSYYVTVGSLEAVGLSEKPMWGDYKLAKPLNAHASFVAGETTDVRVPVVLHSASYETLRVPVLSSGILVSAYALAFQEGGKYMNNYPLSAICDGHVEVEVPNLPDLAHLAIWATVHSEGVQEIQFGIASYQNGKLVGSESAIGTPCKDVKVELVSKTGQPAPNQYNVQVGYGDGKFSPNFQAIGRGSSGGYKVPQLPMGIPLRLQPGDVRFEATSTEMVVEIP